VNPTLGTRALVADEDVWNVAYLSEMDGERDDKRRGKR